MLGWLATNKDWVFSGIGVLVISLLFKVFYRPKKSGDSSSENFSITHAPSVNQEPVITTAPVLTQAPVLHITNNVGASDKPPLPLANISQTIKAPLFTLNPGVVTRDLITVTGSSIDGAAEACIARFKMLDGVTGSIPHRFEVSIDYVERLSASGFPYEHPAGHMNQARWLTEDDGVHELILVLRRSFLLYAVSGVDNLSDLFDGDGSLVRLDCVSDKPFASVTLTDTSNGQKWCVEYAIGSNPSGMLTVRETSSLRRG